jgi:hypothetical protein
MKKEVIMKKKEKEYLFGMDRREFIKTTGIVGGAAMLGINPFEALIAEAAVEPMDDATLAEQDKLYAAAKKERQVTLYQSSNRAGKGIHEEVSRRQVQCLPGGQRQMPHEIGFRIPCEEAGLRCITHLSLREIPQHEGSGQTYALRLPPGQVFPGGLDGSGTARTRSIHNHGHSVEHRYRQG